MDGSKSEASCSSILHPALDELYSKGPHKYCDVRVHIGDRSFLSHRLLLATLSHYFDDAFDVAIATDGVQEVVLPDTVNASAFERILNYLYTGKLDIEDVRATLELCDVLKTRTTNIEDRCLECLRTVDRQNETVRDGFALLKVAAATDRTAIVRFLRKHIFVDRADYFLMQSAEFLQLTYDELDTMLERGYFAIQDGNVLTMNALVRWVEHSPEQRRTPFRRLLDRLEGTLSPVCVKRMLSVYERLLDGREGGASATTMKSASPIPGDRKITVRKLLHMFVQYPIEEMVRMFSRDEKTNWSCLKEFADTDTLRTCVLDDSLYKLTYSSGDWFTAPTQTFSLSVPTRRVQELHLVTPPLLLENYELCAWQAGKLVYVYNADVLSGRAKTLITGQMTEEELSRGMFAFSCARNRWEAMPPMDPVVGGACMTGDENALYLIGGRTAESGCTQRQAHAFDHRTQKWRKLARPRNAYSHEDSTCCMHQGKLYSARNGLFFIEVYDPVEGKWSRLRLHVLRVDQCKLVSYQDRLRAIVRDVEQYWRVTDIYYDPTTRQWCWSGKELVTNVLSPLHVKDAVVF